MMIYQIKYGHSQKEKCMEQGSIQEPRQKAWEMMDMAILNFQAQIQNTTFHHTMTIMQLKDYAIMNQVTPLIGGCARLFLTLHVFHTVPSAAAT